MHSAEELRFLSAGDTPGTAHIAYFNGAWQRIGFGLDGNVNALVVRSSKVIAGGGFAGSFTDASQTSTNTLESPNIAQWSGTAWTSLGGGLDGIVEALITLPNNKLIVGGAFNNAYNIVAGQPVLVPGTHGVACWDGSVWSALGGGISGDAKALAVMPNGDLVVAGDFAIASDSPTNPILDTLVNNIARFSLSTAHWSAFGGGLIAPPSSLIRPGLGSALAIMPSGELVVGGTFEAAGDTTQVKPFFARWSDDGRPWIAVAPPIGVGMGASCPHANDRIDLPVVVATGYDFAGALTFAWTHTLNGTVTVINGPHGTAGTGGTVGGTVTGALSETLSIQGYTSADQGGYTVTVSNGCSPPAVTASTVLGLTCPAEFNGDCTLNVQDIFDFLTAWFAGDPHADFNGNNGVTVQDIFDFLSAWFIGCV